ncbi:MAG: RNA methyltransferase [Victivallales bacterium]|nr:RNA methyltransferase [Victivallales bacterium]
MSAAADTPDAGTGLGMTRRREMLLRALATRHGRKKYGLCLCEGMRCCRDLYLSAPELIAFMVCADDLVDNFPGRDVIRIPRDGFRKFSATVASPGIMAVARRPQPVAGAPRDPFVLVLDRVADPGNFGTIIRTARAVGLREIWYTAGAADPFSDKVIRAAMASQFVIGMREFPDLEAVAAALRQYGYEHIYRTDVNAGADCFTAASLFERTAIVMGSEAHGAGPIAGATALTIPMPGDAESLNVAQAATVILFEYVRRSQLRNGAATAI